MNILYLSCHEILEYDEIKLFTEMGHKVVSYGAYSNPNSPGILRPKIDGMFFDNELYQLVLQSGKDFPHPKLVEWADVVIVMHKQEWVAGVHYAKRIIWRSIGQNTAGQEQKLKFLKGKSPRLQIVRYSPYEKRISGYAGEDACIRFYKDEQEFDGWQGSVYQGMTIAQSMPNPGRQRELNYSLFEQVAKQVPLSLFGVGNESSQFHTGELSYNALKQTLKQFRFYFYTGTMPAPYTLGFIEALMTGIPIVAIGEGLAYDNFYQQNTYEVANILKTGKNGFVSDDATTLVKYCRDLLDNPQMAKKIGDNGRATAVELFGKEIIRRQWEAFL
jgi:hypothetical protein